METVDGSLSGLGETDGVPAKVVNTVQCEWDQYVVKTRVTRCGEIRKVKTYE